MRDAEGKYHGLKIDRPDALCRACEDSAFEAIRQLGDDYGRLTEHRGADRAVAQGPKVSGSGTNAPIPISLGVDTLMCAIDDETLRWAVRITKGDPVPTHPTLRVRRCVAILGANLGTLVDMPRRRLPALLPHPEGGDYAGLKEMDGVDAVLALASLHQRAQLLLGETESTVFLRDPCPQCGRKALAVSRDQQFVTCKGCQIVWDSEHFAHLTNVLDFERKRVKA